MAAFQRSTFTESAAGAAFAGAVEQTSKAASAAATSFIRTPIQRIGRYRAACACCGFLFQALKSGGTKADRAVAQPIKFSRGAISRTQNASVRSSIGEDGESEPACRPARKVQSCIPSPGGEHSCDTDPRAF